MKQKSFLRSILLLACLLALLSHGHAAYGAEGPPIAAGTQLNSFTFPAPDSPQTQAYLGLKTMEPFTLSKIGAKLVLIEFLSAM